MKYVKVCPFCGHNDVARSEMEPGEKVFLLCSCNGCEKTWLERWELEATVEMKGGNDVDPDRV